MQWSPQQERALATVNEWIKSGSSGPQVLKFQGYAGTGKTTLVKHFASMLDRTTLFATFTGKAAHVLRSKGCPNASTVHSLIYQPRERGTFRLDDMQKQLEALLEQLKQERPDVATDVYEAWVNTNENVRRLRTEIEEEKRLARKPLFQLKTESVLREAGLLVLDEVSMVDKAMAEDLLSFGVKILAIGDPAQLPPVAGSGYFIEGTPDVLLTEIHRQALDNPILRLATQVRNGESLQLGEYGETRVIDLTDAEKSLYTSHDQIICGRNKTRRGCNQECRRILGFNDSKLPLPGDKIVCLRNNNDLGIFNGSIWRVKKSELTLPQRVLLQIEPDGDGQVHEVLSHDAYFLGQEPPYYEIKEAECFDFGYALTAHKSQGSEWNSVLILDESRCFREHKNRWLYTAITRAAQRATVVLM